MFHKKPVLRGGLAVLTLLASIIFLPGEVHAVVGNVSGTVIGNTGKPLGEATITITNEETGDTAEGESDRDGAFFILLEDKNWKPGRYAITVKEGDRAVTQQVTLTDGSNQIELSTILGVTAAKKDFRLSDPITIPMPETTAGDVAATVSKGLLGAALGGFFGGRSDEADQGPDLAQRPPYPEQILTSEDGNIKVDLAGAVDNGTAQIVVGVKESPDNCAPHLVVLQDDRGRILQPAQIAVYEIWELWGGWKLTVSWTKSYYTDGQLVKQERGGWNTSWTEFLGRFNNPGEIPSIWKDFGGKPFDGIRGIIADFEAPTGESLNPADWNVIVHITSKGTEGDTIVTQPFVADMIKGKDGVLTFKERERTVWEAALH